MTDEQKRRPVHGTSRRIRKKHPVGGLHPQGNCNYQTEPPYAEYDRDDARIAAWQIAEVLELPKEETSHLPAAE